MGGKTIWCFLRGTLYIIIVQELVKIMSSNQSFIQEEVGNLDCDPWFASFLDATFGIYEIRFDFVEKCAILARPIDKV